jgi:hypothetical protein
MTSAHTRAQSNGTWVARRSPAWMAAARSAFSSSVALGSLYAAMMLSKAAMSSATIAVSRRRTFSDSWSTARISASTPS